MTDRDYVPAATALRIYAAVQTVVAAAAMTVAVLVSGPDISDSASVAGLFALIVGPISAVHLRDVLRRAPEVSDAPLSGAEAVLRGEQAWLPLYTVVLILIPAFPELCALPLGFAAVLVVASFVVERWQARHDRLLVRAPRVRFGSRGVFDHRRYAMVSRRGPEAALRA